MDPSQAHIAPEKLDAFLKGACSGEEASAVERHIDLCEECRVLLSSLVLGQRDAATDPTHQVTVAPVTEGDVVAGKYKIERIVGAGGMGSVIAAWHQQLNQRVALKFMLPAIAADPHAAARFLREGRAAARLSTPHVGRVIDLDSLPNGTPYLVMEFLEGETLAQRLTRGALGVAQAVESMRQALVALQEAHALGIVHRDFKPANLFFARRPDGSELVKVLDFGIAKSVHPDIEQGLVSTSSRMLIGSPPYMSPEQVSFQPVDARTDVWAAGAVLYEMLAGRVPFDGKTVGDVMFAIQNKAHEPLARAVPAVSPALSALVDRCLAKRSQDRFADAAALAGALGALLAVAVTPATSAAARAPLADAGRNLGKAGRRFLAAGSHLFQAALPVARQVAGLPRPALGAAGAGVILVLGLLGYASLSHLGLLRPAAPSEIVHRGDAPRVEHSPMPPPPPAPAPAPSPSVAAEPAPVPPAAAAGSATPARKAQKKRSPPPAKPSAANAFEERR